MRHVRRLAALLALLAIAAVVAGSAATAAHGQTGVETTHRIKEALETICDFIDLGKAVEEAVTKATNAINSLRIEKPLSTKQPNVDLKGSSPNDLGKAGEESVGKALADNELDAEHNRYRFEADGRGRRVDYRVGDDIVEVKNVDRVRSSHLPQFDDYARHASERGGHTHIAIRRGAKISRSTAMKLAALQGSGLLSIYSCALPY